ncbi:MAG TPA: hypothetical protein VK607_15945 [Kofleriaceae bacterium]|nr:hypothetical protein [Kofleriaceae bacterium]
MPPLVDGESPPDEAPNYFDARELGSATLATLGACQGTIARFYPGAADATRTAYCGCFADAARSNVRAGRAVTPTEAQVGQCIAAARTREPSPFARQFAVATASIATAFDACQEATAEGASASYRGFVCSCTTNAWIANRPRIGKLDEDRARCAAAARYWQDTGQPPTTRQFGAIQVGSALERTAPGTFIPYPGNARGPLLCSDGTYSHSSGRGTCSRHGGISSGHRRRR